MTRHRLALTTSLLASAASLALASLLPGAARAQAQAQEATDRFVVRMTQAQPSAERAQAASSRNDRERAHAQLQKTYEDRLPEMARAASVGALTIKRATASGHGVVQMAQPLAGKELASALARVRALPGVESVEPDYRVKANAPAPATNDTYASSQWWHLAGTSKAGAANLWAAYNLGATGAGVTVAVLDSGYVSHPDVPAPVGGYDFIADLTTAGDGTARDADPSDPGDYCLTAPAPTNSTWHGLRVSSLINAARDNATGYAGAAPGAAVFNVRVLGRCGGYLSDIADALSWLAGQSIAGLPLSGKPARVLNLSLGADRATCPSYMQSAVNAASSAGLLVVASAGNAGHDAQQAPANCTGVLSVGASSASGDLASYSGANSSVALLAPGGGNCSSQTAACDSTPLYAASNNGTTSVGANSYATFSGTSASAPLVSAAAALILSVRPELTAAQVATLLTSTTRSFPLDSRCASPAYASRCGAGLLDAGAAVAQALGQSAVAQVTTTSPPLLVRRGATMQVTASGYAASDYTWSWQQISGPAVTGMQSTTSATASFRAPSTSGPVVLRVTGTSATLGGSSASADVTFTVDEPPSLDATRSVTSAPGKSVSVPVQGADSEGDVTLSVVSFTTPTEPRVVGNALSFDPLPAGTYRVDVAAVDSAGQVTNSSVSLSVRDSSAQASSGGGGGGATGVEDLAALALAAAFAAWTTRKSR